MTDKELEPLMEAWGRRLWPAMASRMDDAHLRLGSVIYSGDARQVRSGVSAMTDWIDAKVGCLVYALCFPDDIRDDG